MLSLIYSMTVLFGSLSRFYCDSIFVGLAKGVKDHDSAEQILTEAAGSLEERLQAGKPRVGEATNGERPRVGRGREERLTS